MSATQDRIDLFRRAGFKIEYAIPSEAYELGYVRSTDITTFPYADADRPFIRTGVRGECRYDQSSTVDRSNFRSLERDYPGTFVRVSYSNVDELGVFVHSITDNVAELIIGLVEQWHIHDDSDHSELESEEIAASFDQYLWSDTYRTLPEWAQELADDFDDTVIRDRFYAACHAEGYYPDHDGHDVLWDDDRVTAIIVRVLRDLRREQMGRPVLVAA